MFSELHLFIIFFVSIILRNDQKIEVGHLIEALCIHFLQPRTLRTRADTPIREFNKCSREAGTFPHRLAECSSEQLGAFNTATGEGAFQVEQPLRALRVE
jgi:hypothetical protein